MQPIRAVTFDFWNTLMSEDRGHLRNRRLTAWEGIAEEAGLGIGRPALEAAFDSSWQRYVDHWTAGRQYSHRTAVDDILERLGVDVPGDVAAQLADAFSRAAEGAELHVTPNAAACLHALRDAGCRIGIVCDVGMTASPLLREHLRRQGLLDLFDHWSFSDEVGYYKPAREIFEHALSGLGVQPAETAHVGDLRRTDVAGALAMGMTAVRYTGVFDDDADGEPEAHLVVADHAHLPQALGLGDS